MHIKMKSGKHNLIKKLQFYIIMNKFAELNDDILFGEVWSREDKLSLRDRSMITISALMAQKEEMQNKKDLKI